MAAMTRDGRHWQQAFLLAIDSKTCIGCGRCFKVCGRGVMGLVGVDGEEQFLDLDDEDEIVRKVMRLDDAGACVGCGACARVCPTNCQTHGSVHEAGG